MTDLPVTDPAAGEAPPPVVPEVAVRPRPTTILSGVDALARLLVLRQQLDEAAGLHTATMVSGYPGSPLGTFDLTLEKLGPELAAHAIHHRPGLNEELAAATVWGSQMGASIDYAEGVDGVAGAWYGKTPGLDRCGDVLKHANAMGAGPNGGAVMFCGDDPGAKSSTLNCDSQQAFEDACVPVLYPGDQQEVLDLGVHAFHLSRYAGAWVGLKVVTSVADGIGSVDVGADRHHPTDPEGVVIAGQPWQHQPLPTIGPHAVPDQEALVVDLRLQAARAYVRHNGLDRVSGAGPGAAIGIVCAGKTYFDVVQALADLGVTADELAAAGIRILKLAMTYPLVEETVLELADSVDEVVVIEEKRPFVESQLRAILHEARRTVPVVGKRDRDGSPLSSTVGELDPGSVAKILTRVVPALAAGAEPVPARSRLPLIDIPGRAPGYCSGCPHNRSTVAPEGALVGGGVGCHGIMYFEARNAGMKRLPPTPMGSEGVPWLGLAPFVDEPHLIQNIGDGTLSHSGTLAIRASIAGGVDVTFKILYNAAVAMTGGQDVTGLLDVPSMTRALEAEGVRKVVVCAEDPKHYGRRARWARGVEVFGRGRLPEVQEELRAVPGVTVIIYDQQCAAEARRLRKRGDQVEPPQRVVINEAVCEGCGDCSTKSNCLSVQPIDTEFGEKREIHDPSCNRDYTCLEGDCPSFVTITPKAGAAAGSKAAPAAATRPRPTLPAGALPGPELPTFDRQYGVCFSGIGGTGVVTANRVIAAAAEASGLVIEGMDQTGLSQKAGAVVSHLHLARQRDALGSAAIGPAGADLYLSGDVLQAASSAHLTKVRPGRTIAVVDASLTPTTAMLQTQSHPPDVAALRAAIAERVGAERVAFIDSKGIADAVFANHLLANVVLLGAAFQLGGLPLPLAALDAAQGAGSRGDQSREAFAWGRWAVHDPAAVEAQLDAVEETAATTGIWDPSAAAEAEASALVVDRQLPAELRTLLIRRAAQAIDYQDAARARRFLDLVTTVAAADGAEHGWALTRAAAESWFKLLTYKDEYEVARLHRKVDYGEVARSLGIEGDYTVTYQLHPPVLRRLGRKTKLPMGAPYRLGFGALARMKGLRGTRLDLFGLDRDRKAERALIEEYAALVPDLTGTRLSYETRVELAASAQAIKGYAVVKDRAIERWHARVTDLTSPSSDPAAASSSSSIS
ncbi:indolepyruvate ferredoxin oxidoreductase family protein [Aquihabitans sp. McL0605]|uniref:indolepyruvate ferredoxin oxidoreductase family protein n=1 Tax=Aquihabitans sp. McL0605 TaxID=3415671 RepID=UPI003CF29F3F